MNQTNQEEVKLLDLQLITTLVYVGSLGLSILLTYHDRAKLMNLNSPITDEQALDFSKFNRFLVLGLTLIYLYVNYKNVELAKEKGKDLAPFHLQVTASELSTLSAIIVLYVVLKTAGEQYGFVIGAENPNL